jgi:hypothetical protein
MTTWYEYVCLDCGYSGRTKDPTRYQRGEAGCPQCGGMHLELQEQELAPLPDEEESSPEIEED